jgi:hypothetical protein
MKQGSLLLLVLGIVWGCANPTPSATVRCEPTRFSESLQTVLDVLEGDAHGYAVSRKQDHGFSPKDSLWALLRDLKAYDLQDSFCISQVATAHDSIQQTTWTYQAFDSATTSLTRSEFTPFIIAKGYPGKHRIPLIDFEVTRSKAPFHLVFRAQKSTLEELIVDQDTIQMLYEDYLIGSGEACMLMDSLLGRR